MIPFVLKIVIASFDHFSLFYDKNFEFDTAIVTWQCFWTK